MRMADRHASSISLAMKIPALKIIRMPLLLMVFLWAMAPLAAAEPARFQVSFPEAVESPPLTGRLIVFVARNAEPEPRNLVTYLRTPAIFGVDVEGVGPDTPVIVDAAARRCSGRWTIRAPAPASPTAARRRATTGI